MLMDIAAVCIYCVVVVVVVCFFSVEQMFVGAFAQSVSQSHTKQLNSLALITLLFCWVAIVNYKSNKQFCVLSFQFCGVSNTRDDMIFTNFT